jgi:hypothetical protein
LTNLFNHHDPPPGPEGVIRVLKFHAEEPESLEDYLEQVRIFADAIIANISFESDTILVIKIHSFKTDPSAFDTFFLVELKSFEGITCIYQGEEDEPCQEHT